MNARLMLLASTVLVSPAYGKTKPPPDNIVEASFLAGSDGNQPQGSLLATASGMLYGTTIAGGPAGNGTVFSLIPATGQATSGKEQTIYTFKGGADGSMPVAGLLMDQAGAIYGTASLDGSGGWGTAFMLTPPADGSTRWTQTTLYSFTGQGDGGQPMGALIADGSGSGVLYGTTHLGGANNLGVVFSLTPPVAGQTVWTETVLYSFDGDTGSYPLAALIQDASGNLFGTASTGGSFGVGVAFELSPPGDIGANWTQTVLWNFTGGNDGATPQGTLIADATGALYGTATYGGQSGCAMASYPYYGEPGSVTAPTLDAPYVGRGANDCGVAFKLTSPNKPGDPWIQSLVWTFQGGEDGDNPVSELLFDAAGSLYGTVPLIDAGLYKGALFKLTSSGGAYTASQVHPFTGEQFGSYPRAGVVKGADGRLYGTNSFGGSTWRHTKVYGYGALFGALP